MMMMSDLHATLRTVQKLVLAAGRHAQNALHNAIESEQKDNHADLVTKTDKEVEDMLLAGISSHFPSHKFIGEETVAAGNKCILTDDPTWIIDPIDGTSNFIHRFEYFCISVGFYVEKKASLAIVYNVPDDKLYTAVKGHGAFCNGRELHCSSVKEMSQALVITEFGNQRDPDFVQFKINSMTRVMKTVQCLRCLGSAALNVVKVACGEADAYYEYGLHCWDSAAGVLIATEAGAVVSSPTGGEFDLMSRKILVTSTKELSVELSSYLTVDFPIERD